MKVGAHRSCRILLVEDDPDLRDALAEALDGLGFSVTLARDGADALACLRGATERPGLILLDFQMPNMNGIQFREEQLSSPDYAAIPVAIMTADAHAKEKMASLGLIAFLSKPLSIPALLEVTRNVFGTSNRFRQEQGVP